jgi:hypothetical protein
MYATMMVVNNSRKSSTHRCNHPETPEVRRGEVVLGLGEQAHGVESGDGERDEEEQPGQVAHVLALQPAANAAIDDRHPEEQAHGKQHLPEAAKVEVLEALIAKPRPQRRVPAEDADPFADHAAYDDQHECAEQSVRQPVLPARLTARKLHLAGASHIMSPYTMAGQQMAMLAVLPSAVDFVETLLRGARSDLLLEDVVAPASALVGASVAEVRNRFLGTATLLAIRRGNLS